MSIDDFANEIDLQTNQTREKINKTLKKTPDQIRNEAKAAFFDLVQNLNKAQEEGKDQEQETMVNQYLRAQWANQHCLVTNEIIESVLEEEKERTYQEICWWRGYEPISIKQS